jgi:hypothetical protein
MRYDFDKSESWFNENDTNLRKIITAKTVLHYIQKHSSGVFFDFGGGKGSFLKYLDSQFRSSSESISNKYLVFDKYEKIEESFQLQHGDLNFISYNLGNSEYKNEVNRDIKADYLFCFETIEHVIDPGFLLDQIKESSHDNTLIFISTPNLSAWFERILLLFGFQPANTEIWNGSRKLGREAIFKLFSRDDSEGVGHLRLMTLRSFKSILNEKDLEIVEMKRYPVLNNYVNKLICKCFPSLSDGLMAVVKKRETF